MDHHRHVLAAVRAAARNCILPRFRHLGVGEVDQKSDFADLVTIADTEAEAERLFTSRARSRLSRARGLLLHPLAPPD